LLSSGDLYGNPGYNYQIPLSVLLPPADSLSNLLVPVCVSSSHVAYATLRMEPQYMIMGHSAGVVAAISIKTGVAVQNVDTAVLNSLLLADNQTLGNSPPPPLPPPIPGANCTFYQGIKYVHVNTSWPAQSKEECCNICRQHKCAFAVFRFAGFPANTCWAGEGYEEAELDSDIYVCVPHGNPLPPPSKS
jgi:hypothetical protein